MDRSSSTLLHTISLLSGQAAGTTDVPNVPFGDAFDAELDKVVYSTTTTGFGKSFVPRLRELAPSPRQAARRRDHASYIGIKLLSILVHELSQALW